MLFHIFCQIARVTIEIQGSFEDEFREGGLVDAATALLSQALLITITGRAE